MKLCELIPLIVTPPRLEKGGIFRRPRWVYEPIKRHARKSWGGRAYIGHYPFDDPDGSTLRIFFDGQCATYAVSFDDAIADDWELVL